MSTFIQIHTLTSHSTHCLNRDDIGQPKTVRFLDRNYGRISSQCQKRSIREYMRNTEMTGNTALRTKRLPEMVKKSLLETDVDRKAALSLIPAIAALGEKKPPSKKVIDDYMKLALKTDIEDDDQKKLTKAERTPQLFHMKLSEIETIKEVAFEICQEGGKPDAVAKKFKKTIEKKLKNTNFKDGVDIALFGRMTTSPVFDDCDAAVPVAHAITTHPILDQSDFFTAVDDLGGEGEGSGHMDDKAFSAGIFYRYASVNYDQLMKNMDQDEGMVKQAVDEFLKAFIMAIPTGSQNSFAAYQQPYLVLVTAGTGCPTNLSNAFADGDTKIANPLKKAAVSLIDEYIRIQAFFGELKPVEFAGATCQYDEFLKKDYPDVVIKNSIPKLLDEIGRISGGK
ncbi:type I-E CRISPR-associated protein Cas7/Cse4/CasC [Desulfobacterales bacterium HSG16]|nr:type I-E CRISPR-associated protein Cas7/Cse4/CasC [Desulfobacterales bacterium HSG16]